MPTDAALLYGRYMRNDLTRLQIRCVNAAQGCETVISLEGLQAHEDQCEFAFVPCTNACKPPFCAIARNLWARILCIAECIWCEGNVTPGLGAAGGSAVAMAASQTSAPLWLGNPLQTLIRVHSLSALCRKHEKHISRPSVSAYTFKRMLLSWQCCYLLLAGGEYICYHCGRYRCIVCACSVQCRSVNHSKAALRQYLSFLLKHCNGPYDCAICWFEI